MINTAIILAEFVKEVKEESESLSKGLPKTFNFTEAGEVIIKILISFECDLSEFSSRKPAVKKTEKGYTHFIFSPAFSVEVQTEQQKMAILP